jgi:LuxR family transcriptional regulator, maltose regulon positive regulatory protein
MTFALTKIQPPRPRAAAVERASLESRLAAALAARRVVLVCAPAGFGKTALVARALERLPAGTGVAWVAADEGDDLERLVECILAALEPCDPPWRTAPERLAARIAVADEPERRALAAEIINTLEATDVAHGVIVFDDLHRVTDLAFHAFLDLLVERLGEHWTIAISSRSEPPLALARRRAAGELAEFRQPELAVHAGRDAAPARGLRGAVADALHDRTQGWPAGLSLAASALAAAGAREQGSRASFERGLRAADRPLFDFLLAEVLEGQRPELVDFLLRTSVLAELEPARCAEVSGVEGSGRLLDEVERLDLFVTTVESPARTLRLHDLFREALQHRLGLEQPGLLAELRRRAAATERDPLRRIALLVEAGEPRAAAAQLFEHAPLVIPRSGTKAVERLLGLFPPGLGTQAAQLAFVRGLVAWVHWDFPAMLADFQQAESAFAAAGDGADARLARAFRATALIARGRFDEAAAALGTLQSGDVAPPARIMALNAEIWLAIDTGRLRSVAALLDRMLDLLQEEDRVNLWYHTTPPNRLPGLPGVVAPLERHAALLARVAGDEPTPLGAMAVLSQAWCELWRGRMGEAERLLRHADADAQWSGTTGAVRTHQLVLGALLAAIRDDARASLEAAWTRAREFDHGYGTWGRYNFRVLVARVAGITGQLQELQSAWREIEALRTLLDQRAYAGGLMPLEPLAGQLAWLEGRPDEAIDRWAAALEAEEAIDLYGQAAETRLRLARALLRRGEPAAAATVAGSGVRARAAGGWARWRDARDRRPGRARGSRLAGSPARRAGRAAARLGRPAGEVRGAGWRRARRRRNGDGGGPPQPAREPRCSISSPPARATSTSRARSS